MPRTLTQDLCAQRANTAKRLIEEAREATWRMRSPQNRLDNDIVLDALTLIESNLHIIAVSLIQTEE